VTSPPGKSGRRCVFLVAKDFPSVSVALRYEAHATMSSSSDTELLGQLACKTLLGARQACEEHDELTSEVTPREKRRNYRYGNQVSRNSSSRCQ
jgi:hypothetical protein